MRIQYRSLHPYIHIHQTRTLCTFCAVHRLITSHIPSPSPSLNPPVNMASSVSSGLYSSWSDANARAQTGHIHTQKKGSSQTLDTLAGHNLNTFDCALDAYIHTYTHTYIHTPFKFSFFSFSPPSPPTLHPHTSTYLHHPHTLLSPSHLLFRLRHFLPKKPPY